MNRYKHIILIFASLFICILIVSCRHRKNVNHIVSNPEKMDETVEDDIQDALEFAMDNNGMTEDSLKLPYINPVNSFYTNNKFECVWSHKEKWDPLADSMYRFIQNAALYGLYRNDYHYKELTTLRDTLIKNSSTKKDAVLWTNADLLLTDAFMHITKDLKLGRIPVDSVFAKSADSVITDSFYAASLNEFLDKKQLTVLFNSFEPTYRGYWDIKNGIRSFLDSMDPHIYTVVPYPYNAKDKNDSVKFVKILQKRLYESHFINFTDSLPTFSQLDTAIKKYQVLKGLKPDGIISESLISVMNENDVDRFKSIAITLDRYKHMPDSIPDKYIWVNLPSFYMHVWDHDTLVFESKIICGKPLTPTPLLTGNISNMITYPTWTVPNSIIVKQYLPKLKTDPNYLTKLGLHLINKTGDVIDPTTLNWKKYKAGIPFNVVQGSGDDNSLGVMKFNFNNPFAIYLHDTNQRYLFKNNSRDLSHGCVRVQEWQKLAYYLIRNDSLALKHGQKPWFTTDTVNNLLANKIKRLLPVRNRVALYILYFTCEGKDGKLVFYDDIYDRDKILKEKYFANE
jgi:murein L,D-transpeptidase YcbB/YkuD